MSTYKTLADAMEQEVLTEMAGTFFGARKHIDDMLEEFQRLVEDLRVREGLVFSRVHFLRALLLDSEGEAGLFRALGLGESPFADGRDHPGSHSWRPGSLPFALFGSSRYAKAVALAYAEVHAACVSYMLGEYVADPVNRGRKIMTVSRRQVMQLGEYLNQRIDKLNREQSPSAVLQYARSIRSCDDTGQGAITCELGAESLDKGLTFRPLDLTGLDIWSAPELPAPESCAEALRAYCEGFYKAREKELDLVLAAAAQ